MPAALRARSVASMTSPSPTVEELRHGLERLVFDLFESDRRGAIPALEINRRDGQLVVYARLPGRTAGDAPMAVEVRLPCGEQRIDYSTPSSAASASISAAPAAVPPAAA
jgi:hypothetical protein